MIVFNLTNKMQDQIFKSFILNYPNSFTVQFMLINAVRAKVNITKNKTTSIVPNVCNKIDFKINLSVQSNKTMFFNK